MNVSLPTPAVCLGCHSHEASGHLNEDNLCDNCHVPVTAARDIPAARIAKFPRPTTHEARDWSTNHAANARRVIGTCAICHARQTCERCHVNASAIPQIASLPRDARFDSIPVTRIVTYTAPPDHARPAFAYSHESEARAGVLRCGTCHTRESCTTCHIGETSNDVVRKMPNAVPGGARGVQLERLPIPRRPDPPPALSLARPAVSGLTVAQGRDTTRLVPPSRLVRVHDIGFRTAHGAQAAAGSLTCTGCHAQRFCTDCHAGEGRRRFHVENFEVRHAADAWGRENECSSCHNAEAFCRSCHRQSGLGARGRLDAAYHTGQPLWLLQHGRAARQGLANCTTCHQQRDCLTCHSTFGWGVNPHGAGFDAARMAKVAGPMCLRCHVTIPRR